MTNEERLHKVVIKDITGVLLVHTNVLLNHIELLEDSIISNSRWIRLKDDFYSKRHIIFVSIMMHEGDLV